MIHFLYQSFHTLLTFLWGRGGLQCPCLRSKSQNIPRASERYVFSGYWYWVYLQGVWMHLYSNLELVPTINPVQFSCEVAFSFCYNLLALLGFRGASERRVITKPHWLGTSGSKIFIFSLRKGIIVCNNPAYTLFLLFILSMELNICVAIQWHNSLLLVLL